MMVKAHQWMLVATVLSSSLYMAACSEPSRLAVDFSSSLMVSPDTTPASVLRSMDALLSDMSADGINNICKSRLDRHVCDKSTSKWVSLRLPFLNVDATFGTANSKSDSCTLCKIPAPADSPPCSCSAPGRKTRCTCVGALTGAQYFNPSWYSLELAYVLAVSENESSSISGGINANFNSTVRLINSTLTVAPADKSGEGVHDLEIDESHLDLLQGSQLHLLDDADLEVEDNSGLWLSGGSLINATGSSNIQTQLSHILVEGGSRINIKENSEWNVTQEFDMTPAQAAAICDGQFQPNPAAEHCFSNKEECKKQFHKLSGAEKQALGMLRYPPVLDRWGRQAFDYTDDVVYDDYYDEDYAEPELDTGSFLGPEVCGTSGRSTSATATGGGSRRSRMSLLAADGLPVVSEQSSPPPTGPSASSTKSSSDATEADSNDGSGSSDGNDSSKDSSAPTTAAATPRAKSSSNQAESTSDGGDDAQGYLRATEINPPDTLGGKGYDPEWGEGPFGETLCDAPPGRAFNYYGLVIRDDSHIKVSGNSTWVLYDTSRAFIKDSTLTISDSSSLILLNSTLVLINSTLDISSRSQIILRHFSSLQLYQSRVVGDGAMYAVPAGSKWRGESWQQRGDYRASPGGGLPASMGARPGVQLGTYPMRVFGFDLDARLLPAAGCSCKKPRTITTPAAKIVNLPQSVEYKQGWTSPLEGLM